MISIPSSRSTCFAAFGAPLIAVDDEALRPEVDDEATWPEVDDEAPRPEVDDDCLVTRLEGLEVLIVGAHCFLEGEVLLLKILFSFSALFLFFKDAFSASSAVLESVSCGGVVTGISLGSWGVTPAVARAASADATDSMTGVVAAGLEVAAGATFTVASSSFDCAAVESRVGESWVG